MVRPLLLPACAVPAERPDAALPTISFLKDAEGRVSSGAELAGAPAGGKRLTNRPCGTCVRADPAHAYGASPAAGAVGLPGVMSNYGIAATIGFLGVIAISKEFFLLNEELLVALSTLGVLGAAYVTQADTIAKDFQKRSVAPLLCVPTACNTIPGRDCLRRCAAASLRRPSTSPPMSSRPTSRA
jgi:hypothetical protein